MELPCPDEETGSETAPDLGSVSVLPQGVASPCLKPHMV